MGMERDLEKERIRQQRNLDAKDMLQAQIDERKRMERRRQQEEYLAMKKMEFLRQQEEEKMRDLLSTL